MKFMNNALRKSMTTAVLGMLMLSPFMGSAQNTPMPPQPPVNLPVGLPCPKVKLLAYLPVAPSGTFDEGTKLVTYSAFGVKWIKVRESIKKPARGYGSDVTEYGYTKVPDGLNPNGIYIKKTRTQTPDRTVPGLQTKITVSFHELTSYGTALDALRPASRIEQKETFICNP